jgi:hypothetical protein
LESSTTNRNASSEGKGILKFTNKPKVASGQSNLEKSNSQEFVSGQSNLKMSISDSSGANEKWDMDEMNEEETTLDEEKISQLKEQINTWKYRTMRAEERVTRLLQLSERRVKNAHDSRQREIRSRQSVRGELLPRPGGTRARFSDTLELLTEPLWEESPDPKAEWIVIKVPRGNSSFLN